MWNILYLLVGITIGVLATWLVLKGKTAVTVVDPRVAELDIKNAGLIAQRDSIALERKKSEDALITSQNITIELNKLLASREEELRGLNKRLSENKTELENLQEQFKKEFENLANKIFEEKSKKFTEQNKTQIDDILKPLGEKIKDFEKKVNDVYVSEGKERATLKEQLTQLQNLNVQMSRDAQNLTNALKGENKSAGNWGEMILESILEKSGLRKGEQYRAQESFTNAEGKLYQPDIIIDLPGNKQVIIDSKVSLVAFERFSSVDDENERNSALKEHVLSIRNHIRNLSDKNYQKIYQLNSLDFILVFMPVEPAYLVAMQHDKELFNFAYDKNIIIVSPTNLVLALRTIDNFWKQELQNRNVLQIADEAAAMYEKFVGFTESMLEVGRKMDSSKESYQTAMNRLSTGTGNVVRRIENLKKLGLKVSKSIDPKLIERSEENDLPFPDEK
jgi:DNA recombination protein RmuC